MSLTEETKKYMGYSEEKRNCSKCKFSEETEDSHIDRMWNLTCHKNNLCSFRVAEHATCNFYEAKQK